MRTELIFWKKQMEIISHNREQKFEEIETICKKIGDRNGKFIDVISMGPIYKKYGILERRNKQRSNDQRNDRRKLLHYNKQQRFSGLEGQQSNSQAN